MHDLPRKEKFGMTHFVEKYSWVMSNNLKEKESQIQETEMVEAVVSLNSSPYRRKKEKHLNKVGIKLNIPKERLSDLEDRSKDSPGGQYRELIRYKWLIW